MPELILEPGLQADQRRLDQGWLRIGVGLAVAGQAMVFGLAINVTPASGVGYWVAHGGLASSAILVLVFLGRDLWSEAWRAIKQRQVTIDVLFLVTLVGALTGSLVSTIRGSGAVYYEVVSVLIVVHTAGRMLAARSRVAALQAVADTRERFSTVRVRNGRGEIRRPVAEVTADDVVLVAAGGEIGVDGVVLEGRADVQETSLTGEWAPVSRGAGDSVKAGTLALDGDLVIRPREGLRQLDHILAAVEAARVAPNRLQAQADRLMRWFLPVVIGVSLLTFLSWWGTIGWAGALFNAMAVLLVACPCAMGLASPVAVWSGLARLAKLGVVARTGDALVALAETDFVCFDKTGTLSEARLTVLGWQYAEEWVQQTGFLQAAVRLAEANLVHPVAESLCGEGDTEGLVCTSREVRPGTGIIAEIVFPDGRSRKIGVGRSELGQGAPVAAGAAERSVQVFVDGNWAASICLGERWRSGLLEAADALTRLGIQGEVLTGDPTPGGGLPWPVLRGLSAAEKAERVRVHEVGGHRVIFLGDGVNDAVAMAVASGGIALQGGAVLAGGAALATMAGDDLRVLPSAIQVARRAVDSVRSNLWFAASYNTLGMILAALGLLHPVVAALLMVGSSLFVSVRALRATSGEA